MPFFEWKEDLETGNSSIDTQHRCLVKLVNDLYDARHGENLELVIEITLDELVKYTVYHFQKEEDEMEKGHYPDLDQHRKIHQTLTKQVLDFKEQLHNKTTSIDDFLDFLKEWLEHHISVVDMDYKEHLKTDIFKEMEKL